MSKDKNEDIIDDIHSESETDELEESNEVSDEERITELDGANGIAINLSIVGLFCSLSLSKIRTASIDERLSNSKYLSGSNYTIADIGTFPWIARHEWHDIGLKSYKNLTRWYEEISEREGVKKGFAFMNESETPPKPY